MAKSVDRTIYSVSDFITWQKNASLILNPKFQRRPVWRPGAKSYLVDTMLRGFPTPVVFLRELPADLRDFQPRREVVDGQQRLRTLISFIAPMYLKDYKEDADAFTISRSHDKSLAGKGFKDLPVELQQRILDYRFSVHVFSSDTGDREVLESFARMNATGVRLNDQELRNAEYYGEFKSLAFQLAAEQLNRWQEWGIFTPYNIARMDEVEIASEFMILMVSGVSEKSAKVINDAYKKYDEVFQHSDEVARRFRAVFDTISEDFSQANLVHFKRRTLFYCLFAAIYAHMYGLESSLSKQKPNSISADVASSITEAGYRIVHGRAVKEVLDATTRRTTHIKERKTVIEYLLKKPN